LNEENLLKVGSYSVQAAAAMAGISPATLRAWETRYAAVSPDRSESGHRRYDEQGVSRLQQIAALVRRGHSVKDVAQLPSEELEQLLKRDPTLSINTYIPELPRHAQKHKEALLQALESFHITHIILELKWLRTVLSVRDFICGVAAPLFRRLGELVAVSRINIAQEHALSSVLRDQLGDIMYSLQALSFAQSAELDSQMVFATPEGDLHEFGVLMSAALAAVHGLPIYYAGANLPARSLNEAVISTRAFCVVLGNTSVPMSMRSISFEQYMLSLDQLLTEDVQVWVGGSGDRPMTSLPSGRRFLYLNSLDEIDYLLAERSR
jgi:DNA-binding transcriptional MerR regulator